MRTLLHSKVSLAFPVVSVWMRNFWKTLENASVDREHFETKMLYSNVSEFMLT